MKALYEYADVSKQAHWAALRRQEQDIDKEYLCLSAIHALRTLHPGMGLKKLYGLIEPDGIGRDKFLALALRHGYGLERKVSYRRTTFSAPYRRYGNLLIGREFTDVNQLWSSDITYFRIREDFLYISFVLDVYSRRILGFHAADSLHTDGPLEALKMALRTRGLQSYTNLVHHSDRGVQYTSDAYTELLNKYNISISMCDSVFENSHIERVNGTIKNEYLHHWSIDTERQLRAKLSTAVHRYNELRPHLSLNKATPVGFERQLLSNKEGTSKPMKVFTTSTANEPIQQPGQLCLF